MSETGVFGRIGRFLTRARIFTANALFVLLVVLVLILIFGGGDRARVPSTAALVIDPAGTVVERVAIGNPLTELLAPPSTNREVEVGALRRAIRAATEDERITTIVLDLDEVTGLSPSHAQTLGAALRAFQANDKQVIAYGSFYTQAQYLLASFADAVYLHPFGQFLPTGFGINRLYFNELLNNLGINIHVFRVGKYKEFVEPYTRTSMSEESREANQKLVDDLWSYYTGRVASQRQLTTHEFTRYVEDFASELEATGGDMARLALEHQLVDELLTPDQARARIADRVGYDDKGAFNGIGYADYLAAIGPRPTPSGPKQVGVITARGPIVTGAQSGGVIAAEEVIELIRDTRRQQAVKALVVRVDSPGGSAFASELIRQELELTQLAGMPVVVSMGNVAASGGYWISATADAIYAEPTTITGSIGIFGIVPTLEKTLADVGVYSDGVGTTRLARGMDPLTGINDVAARILQANVEDGYARFLTLVARGRDMSVEAVEAVAQGRVWLGQHAHELGLVDELGDLQAAIEHAASLAQLGDDYMVRHLERPLSPQQLLLKQLRERARAEPPAALLQVWEQAREMLTILDDPSRIYAVCLSCNLSW